jgi:glutamate--cysteine ligase
VIQNDNDAVITNADDLLEPFFSACKPPSEFRVGTEAEKFGWRRGARSALPFTGPSSVQAVLLALAQRFEWQPERETADGEIIALRRGQSSVTLEPAGQLELSGAPHASIHDTQREFEQHFSELRTVSDPLDIAWFSLGFHPFARQAELPHVPKLRYGIMERYLPTRGNRALDMMRRTCTVQANLDYASEHDAIRKLRVGLALQPITTALFANSPYYEGRKSELLSQRADVWLSVDPDRTGLLPFAWERDMSFRKYVEWALDVPMFLIRRGDRVEANTQQTFRAFLRDGRHGERAMLSDWRTHINTLFPEVRLKNTLEMRGADAQTAHTCALPALWKGLMYDETALAKAEQLISPLSAAALEPLRLPIAQRGLRVNLLGRPLHEWAVEMLEIAHAGLTRLAVLNRNGESEAVHLLGIERLAQSGDSPANALLAALGDETDFNDRVIAATLV